MNPRPIIDAGPSLNFFATNNERMLFGQVGPLQMPETVHAEVIRKARERRFSAAATVLGRLPTRLLVVLLDDPTPALNAVVSRMSDMDLVDRAKHAKDLGELMVVAHAVVLAEAGHQVTVLIDERQGRRLAVAEQNRLLRRADEGIQVGSIGLISTVSVLRGAIGSPALEDQGRMRKLYTRMRGLDDGLVPIERTDLLAPKHWK